MTTKDKILDEALNLFSNRGYDSVSVNEIALAVGIKAPSLYKHFKGKKEIFNAILDKMKGRYKSRAAELNMNGSDAMANVSMFKDISEEQLWTMVSNLFEYFLHDEYVSRFRKMLTLEQYKNKELAELFSNQYYDNTISYHTMLFELLIQSGEIKAENPNIMALHFYSPIFLLLTLCDRQPQREHEAYDILKQHVKQFRSIYLSENLGGTV